ncbi:MAG: nucleotidyltransferase family protein [Aquabacterium sp.]|nr:nucleotidyltransferase family protein [Aquabacterium sp.]
MSANVPALILAAGRGERMRPLTDHTPKPLLMVQGKRLIEWHLEALARDGVQRVVINTAYLEDQFEPTLGDGSRWGLQIIYSHEGRDHGGALETAGGMAKALPHLGEVFWVLAGDVFVPGFRFEASAAQSFQQSQDWGHMWLVPNPPHVPQGDFALSPQGRVRRKAPESPTTPTYTYSTIGLYGPEMVVGIQPGAKAPLRPYLERAIDANKLSSQVYEGPWVDVGTPERLAELNQRHT